MPYHDIRERKAAEEELHLLKELNEEIIQTMTEGIVVLDAESRFTFINPARLHHYITALPKSFGATLDSYDTA